MGILERISRFVVGGGGATEHDAKEALLQCYADCVARARQLARHAEMAPQPHAVEGLRELAAAEHKQAERLREALRVSGVVPPTVSDAALPPGALNHWARLVQDLEDHRGSAKQLRELTMQFAETLPDTAALLDELCREEQVHCERLRGLIARADPQALD